MKHVFFLNKTPPTLLPFIFDHHSSSSCRHLSWGVDWDFIQITDIGNLDLVGSIYYYDFTLKPDSFSVVGGIVSV